MCRQFAVLFASLLLLLAGRVEAHEVGLSSSRLALAQADLQLSLGLSDRDASALLGAEVDAASLSQQQATALLAMLRVTRGGEPCSTPDARVVRDSNDGLRLEASLTCAATGGAIELDASSLLERAGARHRHHASVVAEGVAGELAAAVLVAGDAAVRVGAEGQPGAARPAGSKIFADYLVIGVEHIVFGIDHLVFLFALLLTARRARDLLAMITAFTVAHSLTLAVSVLGFFRPSPEIIEPLIALTVAYVGVENVLRSRRPGTEPTSRYKLAGLFGLVHGFGFAGALGEVGVPQVNVPLALFSFNAGVELGQIALLALTFPLLELARRREWLTRRGVLALSGVVTVAGMFWFFSRLPIL